MSVTPAGPMAYQTPFISRVYASDVSSSLIREKSQKGHGDIAIFARHLPTNMPKELKWNVFTANELLVPTTRIMFEFAKLAMLLRPVIAPSRVIKYLENLENDWIIF